MEAEPQIKGQLFDNLRSLINIVDQLRDVGVQNYINLPRIAVLGGQSAGKSSLLENIVGLDFLPRGDGLVTRRPLEMRLVHKPDTVKPWAYFFEEKEKKFYDFELVRRQIEIETDKLAGTNKGIIDKPIILTIFSADCPDLTIIDLPGITRIPLKGSDQNENVEKLTTDMARSYCTEERTIILCVIPANIDVTTSDGLDLARKFDPTGERTLGVFTKIDIMNHGEDARSRLMGQQVDLKLGYVGVKNRSQLDINNKMKVYQSLQEEEEYFAKHPVYCNMPKEYLGTRALVSKLTSILFFHISKALPLIIKEIDQKVRDCEEKLRELGPSLPKDDKERMHLVWNMLTDYTENFRNQIRGKYDVRMQSKQGQEISGGAMIKQFLNELYGQFAESSFKATSEYSEEYIEKAITLHQGDSIPGFPSFDSFLYLIMPQLEKLKEPALETLNQIFVYMESLSNNILKRVFQRFPQVLDEISDISSQVLQDQRDKTRVVVENIIDAELGYIFTNDADYLTSKASLVPAQPEPAAAEGEIKQNGGKPAPKAQQEPQHEINPNKLLAKELRSRVDAYYALVIRNLRDSIPKAIGFFLVRTTQDQMQYQLYSQIMKNQQVKQLLEEPMHIAQERETVANTLKVLKNAQKVLRKDPEMTLKKESTSRLQAFTQSIVSKVKSLVQ